MWVATPAVVSRTSKLSALEWLPSLKIVFVSKGHSGAVANCPGQFRASFVKMR